MVSVKGIAKSRLNSFKIYTCHIYAFHSGKVGPLPLRYVVIHALTANLKSI